MSQQIPILSGLLMQLCVLFLLPTTGSAQDYVRTEISTYSDSNTAIVVGLARARHQVQGLRLGGYRSKVFTRLEGRVGNSRFGPGWTVFKYETAAQMHWTRNGDLRVDVQGGRMSGTRMPGFGRAQMADFFEDIFGGDVWFIPSTVGDDIDIMGLPEAEALHPLARGAERFYRYELVDSLRIAHPQRTVRILSINVEPRVASAFVETNVQRGEQLRRLRHARSLFSGRLWIDADSLDVVRLTGAFIGDEIWDNDDDSPQLIHLEADIEYSLHQDRFWLPFRQVLTAHWTFKYLPGADLVGTGITSFADHDVDVDRSEIAFAHEDSSFQVNDRMNRYRGGDQYSYRTGSWQCPDAWEFEGNMSDPRCGSVATTSVGVNRDGTVWEVNLPTLDSLTSYDFGDEWQEAIDMASDEFFENAVREISRIGTTSPGVDASARPVGGLDWKHVYNAFGYNRVQGTSVGGGYQWTIWPAYTTLHLSARYGFNDRHLNGAGILRRDAPGGRFELSAYRTVRDVESWTDGTGVGNSIKALFFGHDDADYYYVPAGFGINFHGYNGWFSDGRLTIEVERQETVGTVVASPLAGDFQGNPNIVDGEYVRGAVSKRWHPGFSGTTDFELGMEGLFSPDSASGRFWGAAHLPYSSARTVTSLRLRAGVVTGSHLPQMRFRLGGPSTVRGYTYGAQGGRTFWSAQGDFEWVVSQWWSPVVFADIGGIDFSDTPLIGVGAGVSLFSGWVRFDISRGTTQGGGFRFDGVLGIPTS